LIFAPIASPLVREQHAAEWQVQIILSRKGFDSAAGGVPSPIVNGEPISLPIPTKMRSETTYELAGLGELVARTTKGRVRPEDLCHEDPMFYAGRCAFGQTGAAQTHLTKRGVGVGDVFIFFGLFAEENGRDRHHRIFGFLKVEEIATIGAHPGEDDQLKGFVASSSVASRSSRRISGPKPSSAATQAKRWHRSPRATP